VLDEIRAAAPRHSCRELIDEPACFFDAVVELLDVILSEFVSAGDRRSGLRERDREQFREQGELDGLEPGEDIVFNPRL
jgi:hypothetical protein